MQQFCNSILFVTKIMQNRLHDIIFWPAKLLRFFSAALYFGWLIYSQFEWNGSCDSRLVIGFWRSVDLKLMWFSGWCRAVRKIINYNLGFSPVGLYQVGFCLENFFWGRGCLVREPQHTTSTRSILQRKTFIERRYTQKSFFNPRQKKMHFGTAVGLEAKSNLRFFFICMFYRNHMLNLN